MSDDVMDEPPLEDIRQIAITQRASLADINEMGAWLLPRIAERWGCSQRQVISWLQLAIPANDQALIRCGDTLGMAHIEPGRLGQRVRINVDFVLTKEGAADANACEPVFKWFAHWARSMDALGLFRLDLLSDADLKRIRSWLGALSEETFQCLIL